MSNRNDTFITLREKYPVFKYESYHYSWQEQNICLQFKFSVGKNILFEPQTIIKYHSDYQCFIEKYSLEELDTLVFNIGMIELISYWKSVCSPTIEILAAKIEENALPFWKKLYYNGLSEFFYTNEIRTTQEDFVQLVVNSDKDLPKLDIKLSDKYIVPIGGGKDSVVSLELLRTQEDIIPLIINPRGATIDCATIAGFENNFFEIKRIIAPRLLELNAEGYLNGHTPFSAMLGFYALMIACLSGRRHIALSNENSANESTVIGTNVNHQYSKSYEFENDFRNYIANYLNDKLDYFSFLRPISEFQIAALFAQQKAYFSCFKSCNVGSKDNIWCTHCAKCLFTFIILSPFLSQQELISIFGEDLFYNEDLLPIFKELCGQTSSKPFECVGTIDEVCLALANSLSKYEELPPLLKYFEQSDEYEDYKSNSIKDALQLWSEMHFLSDKAVKILKSSLKID